MLKSPFKSKSFVFAFCFSTVIIVSTLFFFSVGFVGYHLVALVLLMLLSVFAMLFDIIPVISAAILSALIWNYFFIPPTFTFHIDNAEDNLLFFMYFLIASINAVFTYKIRKVHKQNAEIEQEKNVLKLYDTVFNSLSHELKTPVSVLITGVETLKDSEAVLNEKQKQNVLEEMDIASNRLNHQIENLLNMSRLESGFLEARPDWCDINETVNSLIKKLFNSDEQNRITFNINNQLPLFKLDAGFFGLILFNLVKNALQYSASDKKVNIAISAVESSVLVEVSDMGNGFPETELQNVFRKFYRLPNTKTGGTGLGLSIAKGFTEAQKGSIKIENRMEGGAKVSFSITTEVSFVNQLKNE